MNKENLKRRNWFTLLVVALLGICTPSLIGCSEDDDEYVEPSLTLSPTEGIDIAQTAGATGTFTLSSTRDWSIEKPTENWLSVVPMSGKAGENQEITVTVQANEGKARAYVLNIKASSISKNFEVRQKSKDGQSDLYTPIATLREMFKKAVTDGNVTTGDDGTITYNITESILLKAVVISDRADGKANLNSRKAGYIQDSEGNGAYFRTSDKDHDFALGQQLVIDMKGGTLSKYKGKGSIQFGFAAAGVTVTEGTLPTPVEITIDELYKNGATDGMYDCTLVKIKEAQFANNTELYYPTTTTTTFAYHSMTACGENVISVPFSKYLPDNFKNKNVKKGKGSFIGIAASNLDYKEWNVYPRNEQDLEGISDDESTRCEGSSASGIPEDATRVTIAKLLESFKDGGKFTENNYIEGEVIANPENGNTPDFVVYVADETAGIAVTIANEDKANIATALPLGAKVQVYAKDMAFKNFSGLIQFGNQKTGNTKIVEKTPAQPLQPVNATIQDIEAGKYLSQLVAIANVQFKNEQTTYIDKTPIIDENGNELAVFTRTDATFAAETVKSGSGTFIGVITAFNNPQIMIRNVNDLNGMTGARFPVLEIAVDQKALSFEKAGGSKTVKVTTTVAWTATSDASWCTVSPANLTGDGDLTVNTTANDGAARSAKITITNGSGLKATITVSQAGESTNEGELFFSEYVSVGNEKYLEIFNPTDKAIDLSGYSVQKQLNGGGAWGASGGSINLEGSLAPKAVLVLQGTQAKTFTGTSIKTNVCSFNGDDPVALFKNDEIIDLIGIIDCGKDNNFINKKGTLIRNSSVKSPNPVYTEAEWIKKEANDVPTDWVNSLGSHTMD